MYVCVSYSWGPGWGAASHPGIGTHAVCVCLSVCMFVFPTAGDLVEALLATLVSEHTLCVSVCLYVCLCFLQLGTWWRRCLPPWCRNTRCVCLSVCMYVCVSYSWGPGGGAACHPGVGTHAVCVSVCMFVFSTAGDLVEALLATLVSEHTLRGVHFQLLLTGRLVHLDLSHCRHASPVPRLVALRCQVTLLVSVVVIIIHTPSNSLWILAGFYFWVGLGICGGGLSTLLEQMDLLIISFWVTKCSHLFCFIKS